MTAPSLHNPHLDSNPFLLKGGSKAVLLIHGFTATPNEVRRLATNLTRAGFTTAGPLLPGHGSTPAALNKTRWQDWYLAVEKTCQELLEHYPKVIVGGESAGGLLALLLAARIPGVSAVLAFAPALKIPMSKLQEIQLRLLAPFVEGIPKDDLLGNTTWQGYTINPLKAVIQLRALQKTVRSELKKIHQPLLVLQGKKDTTIDQNSAELVYNGVSSIEKQIHWLEKSGHCLLLDNELHIATHLTMDFLWKV
ncbi:MAG: alpha/beta fold hydrolase [Anaerolineaceae bacterium]|nr:alpha/beta fold hydrolase [Anaerolineaceae bacterium]